ncbi:hypothetical protein EJ05DRAFT_485631 [Pseudovirgaria hyperparasitica]|uniref:Uncharacterized protein n=1 Tax=Pseudovirgaria hyperparasitica TaxID=470096 RepID=A0A6A6W7A4_9PEZI|nr:uncharacterized protein EJ05DRAFT_485631 [Pseudovirgaria hyperparasitica]KAF2758513.1 hypothetical protein EJ05DRAFT_485631 [Pseudovirgaria hyperparasitica]
MSDTKDAASGSRSSCYPIAIPAPVTPLSRLPSPYAAPTPGPHVGNTPPSATHSHGFLLYNAHEALYSPDNHIKPNEHDHWTHHLVPLVHPDYKYMSPDTLVDLIRTAGHELDRRALVASGVSDREPWGHISNARLFSLLELLDADEGRNDPARASTRAPVASAMREVQERLAARQRGRDRDAAETMDAAAVEFRGLELTEEDVAAARILESLRGSK